MRKLRRGAALIEVALTLPILILIAMATWDTCHVLYIKQSAKIAAYEGARLLNIDGVTRDDIRSHCGNLLQSRNITGYAIDIPDNFETAARGDFVRLGISIPANRNSLVTSWFYQGRSFEESAAIMVEH